MLDTASSIAQSNAQPAITVAVDNLSRTRIPGSKHPLAQPAFDIGTVDPNLRLERMVLVLRTTQEQEHQVRTFLDSQQTKGAQQYHKWITPEEFGRKFGPAPADVQTVTGWLQQQGFTVGSVARSGRWIEFSGSSAQVEQAFQTQMRRYSWQGAEHIGNATDISIPSALAPVVRGVLSLHDSFSKSHLIPPYQVHRNAKGLLEPVSPAFTANNGAFHALTPADYAKIYNLAGLQQSGLTGQGQSIALVARSNIELSDVETFRHIFNLPANDPVIILNGPDPGTASGDLIEATLDTEWAGAVAPRATVDVVVTASTATTDGVFLSALYIVDNNLAPVMSVSFGECEANLGSAGTAFVAALWQQAAAQGISVLVSSGDTGAAGCDAQVGTQPATGLAVSALASTPFNTAVGGSEFNENGNDATFWNLTDGAGFGSAIGYIPEMAWNDSCTPSDANTICQTDNIFLRNSSGGGASTVFSKPSWQSLSLAGMPNDNARDVPDVTLAASAAHDGYLICVFGSCQTDATGTTLLNATVTGGTSASSPSFAGILALVNQRLAERQGLANYVLYPLAAREVFPSCNSTNENSPLVISSCVFNDITQGSNQIAGTSGQIGFAAGAGYDLAIGLGSVNATNLVNAWGSFNFQGSQTSLSTPGNTISGTHGQAVPVTVQVQALAGNNVPSGNISLVTDQGNGVGAGTLANGTFSGSVNNLPGGKYNVIARYPGDSTFGGSDSSPIPVNITAEASNISLSLATPTSVPYGSADLFHAVVTGNSGNGFPTGTVSFTDGGSPLISLALNAAGQADLLSFGFPQFGAPLTLTVGTHTISASYSGDNSFQASGPAAPVTVTVTKAIPFVILDAGQTTLTTTQALTLHVFVENTGPILPTGSVQFVDNGSNIGGPVPIAPPTSSQTPQADLQVTLSTPGTHNLTAQYLGDSVYTGSGSNLQAITVTTGTGAATQTSLTPSATSTNVGQQVTFTVNVSSTQVTPALTGTVSLVEGNLGAVGQATLQNGQAVIPVSALFGGSIVVVAQYSGDANYAPSGSAPVTITVARATPTVTLAASATSVPANQQVSLTATIVAKTSVNSSGLIQFFDVFNGGAAQPLGAPQLTTIGQGFNFTFALPAFLPVGSHVITAQFAGNGEVSGGTSNPVTVTVTPAIPFQFTANLGNISLTAGQAGSVTLTVSPNGGFNSATTLSCGSGLPLGATCAFTPPSVTPDGFPVNSVLTISTVAPTSAQQAASSPANTWWGISFATGLAALVLVGSSRRKARARSIVLLMSLCVLSFLLGCGGGGGGGVVNPSNTTTNLSTSGNKVGAGTALTLTANVTAASGGTPTGTVTFLDNGTPLAQPVNLTNGQAQLQVNAGGSPLGIGTHSFTATYNGSAQDQGSNSGTLKQVITGTTQVQVLATSGAQNQQAIVNVTLQ